MASRRLKNVFSRSGVGSGSDTPFHPPPSVGHEIGVMFGGIGAMLVGAVLFYLWWRVKLADELKKEENRVKGLKAKGLFDEHRRSGGAAEREKSY